MSDTVANAITDTVAETNAVADTDTMADTNTVADSVTESDAVTLNALAEDVSILSNDSSLLAAVLNVALTILVVLDSAVLSTLLGDLVLINETLLEAKTLSVADAMADTNTVADAVTVTVAEINTVVEAVANAVTDTVAD